MLRRGKTDIVSSRAIDDSDEVLAAAVQNDREAFLTLYDRYVSRVERYIAGRTHSADVEDIVSTTFLRALTGIGSYRADRGTFVAWLFTIARNAVTDRYRTSQDGSAEDPDWTPDAAPGPESQVLAREEQHAVHLALQSLTPDQRDALALRYFAELPFADIAHALGKSKPATKMLVRRGLDALHRTLEEKNNG